MACVAVIPARGGSSRIPLKNIRAFMGKPIIGYSIQTAQASRLFDRIVVSTDHPRIAEVAKRFGADIHARDEAMASNDVGTRAVMTRVVEDLHLDDNDQVCCIYATAPLMDVIDLQFGKQVMDEQGADHVISVGYPPLQDAAQFYWSKVEALRSDVEYFDTTTTLVPISVDRVCDINTFDDWRMAEQMFEALNYGSCAWTTRRT